MYYSVKNVFQQNGFDVSLLRIKARTRLSSRYKNQLIIVREKLVYGNGRIITKSPQRINVPLGITDYSNQPQYIRVGFNALLTEDPLPTIDP